MTARASKPRRGRPPRADKAATERVEFRATAAERETWIELAGERPLGEWIREQLNAAK